MNVNWVWRSVFKSEWDLNYRGLGSNQYTHTSVLLRKYNLKIDIVFCFCFFCSQYLQHCKMIYVHFNIMLFSSWNKHWLWFIGISPYYTTNICMSMLDWSITGIRKKSIHLNWTCKEFNVILFATCMKFFLTLYEDCLIDWVFNVNFSKGSQAKNRCTNNIKILCF